MFQVLHGEKPLYIQANNCVEASEWIEALCRVTRCNQKRLSFYHPSAFLNGNWLCCKATIESSEGCARCTAWVRGTREALCSLGAGKQGSPYPVQQATLQKRATVIRHRVLGFCYFVCHPVEVTSSAWKSLTSSGWDFFMPTNRFNSDARLNAEIRHTYIICMK